MVRKRVQRGHVKRYYLIILYVAIIMLLVVSFWNMKKESLGRAIKIAGNYFDSGFHNHFREDIEANPLIESYEGIVWDQDSSYMPQLTIGGFSSKIIETPKYASLQVNFVANDTGVAIEVSPDNGSSWCTVTPGADIDCAPGQNVKYRVVLTKSTAIDEISFTWQESVFLRKQDMSDGGVSSMLSLNNPPPDVSLLTPVDGSTQESPVNFSCNATDDATLSSISLFYESSETAWHRNVTREVSGAAKVTFPVVLPPGQYVWNCEGVDVEENAGFAGTNFSLIINPVDIEENFSAPENDANSTSNSSQNTTVLPPNINVTLLAPSDGLMTNISEINISCGAVSNETIRSIALYYQIEGSPWAERGTVAIPSNGSNQSSNLSANASFRFNMTAADYVWNCRAATQRGFAFARKNFSVRYVGCIEDWVCERWTGIECGERICVDENGCKTAYLKPKDNIDCPDDPTKTSYADQYQTSTRADKCTDGRDNEGYPPRANRCMDEKDFECGGIEVACWGGIDDDCDGFIDCADPDCKEEVVCVTKVVVKEQPLQVIGVDEVVERYALQETPKGSLVESGSFMRTVEYFSFLNLLIVGLVSALIISLLILHHLRLPKQPPHEAHKIADFIVKERKLGKKDDEIRAKLKKAGWIEVIVNDGFKEAK